MASLPFVLVQEVVLVYAVLPDYKVLPINRAVLHEAALSPLLADSSRKHIEANAYGR